VPLNRKRLVKPMKKLQKLFRKLDSDPAPEQVHDLRTNSRRFEAAFQALALGDAGIPNSVLKGLARLRKRAGKVRDGDVLTEFAAAICPDGEEDRPACFDAAVPHAYQSVCVFELDLESPSFLIAA
jgi:CHAD domain-containing protein